MDIIKERERIHRKLFGLQCSRPSRRWSVGNNKKSRLRRCVDKRYLWIWTWRAGLL